MLLQYYGIVAGAYGISSYFSLYRKSINAAHKAASKKLRKEVKKKKVVETCMFFAWVIMASVFMPLIIFPYLMHPERFEKTLEEELTKTVMKHATV